MLERLRDREVPGCPGRYVPRLLARYDQNLTFVQTWDGVPLSQKYPVSEFNKNFCDLSREYVARFAKCATSVMRKARVEHLVFAGVAIKNIDGTPSRVTVKV